MGIELLGQEAAARAADGDHASATIAANLRAFAEAPRRVKETGKDGEEVKEQFNGQVAGSRGLWKTDFAAGFTDEAAPGEFDNSFNFLGRIQ